MSGFRPVPPRPDHVAIEHEILELWERERTFEALRERNRGAERRFSFVDGPITANNPMGVHHAWGRSLKDLWQRYHAMLGADQRYQNGFDCQGLWVEVEVEKALGLNSKREIEEYGLDRFARACRDRVAEYAGIQTRQSMRLGQWMDWDRSYFTMTDANISYIWRFLQTCHERGWLYVGHRSMPWCPRCGTSLSQHELIDSYDDITHPSLFVRFPLLDREREYLAVWTTTPWTLPANVAAAVLPEADYARVETLAGVAIVAAERLEHIPLQGTVLGTVKGSDLVGLRYEGPFDDLEAQRGIEHRVIPWDEVSLEEGTGIVHIAPGCGAEDFELSKVHGLEALVPIDESGLFTAPYGWLHGHHASEAARTIIGDLGERGKMIADQEITHRYPVCWRCHTELLYRLVDEWFIRCDEVRAPMIEAARRVTWRPAHYGPRMEDWLNNMGDWCISRKRYWGLPLPFWFCDQGHMTLVGSKEELIRRALRGAEGLEELHRPWIDGVVIACDECGAEATRTTDVGDCWLDAGIVPFSTMGWENASFVERGYAAGAGEGVTTADLPDHAHWQTWFPADWISESREQIRLWFYSMLFMSVTLVGETPYKTVLGYERVTDETGRPMHKSWGNAIWFDDAVESMGADVMRWIYAGAEPARNFGFGYGPANEAKRRLLTLWNSYSFFVTYASIEGFTPDLAILERGPATARALDRWLVARSNALAAACREAFDSFDSPRAVRRVEEFWEDLSNWYIRLSRKRFYGQGDPADTRAAFETLWYALVRLVQSIAPVMPFLADHIWRNLVAAVCPGAPASVHLSSFPAAASVDEEVLRSMDEVRTVVALGREARAQNNVKVRQPLLAVTIATEDAGARERIAAYAALVEEELNVKEVRLTATSEDFAQIEVVPNFRVLGPKLGPAVAEVGRALKAGEYERRDGRVHVAGHTLEEGEYEVRTRGRADVAVAEGEGFAVALDTNITPALELEGRARDLIRAINDARKEAGLDLTDRVHARFPSAAADVVEAHGDWIARETLAKSLEAGDAVEVSRA